MKKIICTATSFGYGPVGKLLAICKRLKEHGVQMDLLADGLVLELSRHVDYFTNIIPFDSLQNDLVTSENLHDLFKEADLMLNVLEPNIVKFTKHFGLQTVYVDSLFWMWEDIPPELYNVYYIAQTYPGVEDKRVQFKERLQEFRVCGPIVDTSYLKQVHTRENFLLVNLSGLENPFTKFGANLYYPEAIVSTLIEPLNNSSYEKIVITGNSQVMQSLKEHYGSAFRGQFTHLSHDNFLRYLATCKMILTSPGLTTTYESLVYKTPIRFLPPQNYSQALMLQGYQQSGFADLALNWSDVYEVYSIPNNLPEAEGVNLVSKTIERFASDVHAQGDAKRRLSEMIQLEPPFVEKQLQVLGENLKDGTAEIVEVVLKRIASFA